MELIISGPYRGTQPMIRDPKELQASSQPLQLAACRPTSCSNRCKPLPQNTPAAGSAPHHNDQPPAAPAQQPWSTATCPATCLPLDQLQLPAAIKTSHVIAASILRNFPFLTAAATAYFTSAASCPALTSGHEFFLHASGPTSFSGHNALLPAATIFPDINGHFPSLPCPAACPHHQSGWAPPPQQLLHLRSGQLLRSVGGGFYPRDPQTHPFWPRFRIKCNLRFFPLFSSNVF